MTLSSAPATRLQSAAEALDDVDRAAANKVPEVEHARFCRSGMVVLRLQAPVGRHDIQAPIAVEVPRRHPVPPTGQRRRWRRGVGETGLPTAAVTLQSHSANFPPSLRRIRMAPHSRARIRSGSPSRSRSARRRPLTNPALASSSSSRHPPRSFPFATECFRRCGIGVAPRRRVRQRRGPDRRRRRCQPLPMDRRWRRYYWGRRSRSPEETQARLGCTGVLPTRSSRGE